MGGRLGNGVGREEDMGEDEGGNCERIKGKR